MVWLLRHRQTKETATAMLDLRPPRHISTLPMVVKEAVNSAKSDVGYVAVSRHPLTVNMQTAAYLGDKN